MSIEARSFTVDDELLAPVRPQRRLRLEVGQRAPREPRSLRHSPIERTPVNDWIYRVFRLADRLTEAGDLRTAAWRQAFCGVPRHELVPRYFEPHGDGTFDLVDSDDPSQRATWLEAAYSDLTLVTTLTDVHTGVGAVQITTSASTKPGLMMRILEDLDVSDGQRVLEIGTATGYNAALLCARLGDRNVYSVDIQPDLIEVARDRLAGLGHQPTLVAKDGVGGLPEHGPYDRILSTCAVRQIPLAWIEQTQPGGLVVTDVQGALSAGNIVKLSRGEGPVLSGRFLTRHGGRYGNFMPLQRDIEVTATPNIRADQSAATERPTTVPPSVLYDGQLPIAFLAQLHLPPTITLSRIGGCHGIRTRLTTTDGSWCEVADQPDGDGEYRVTEAGPQRLWEAVEHACRLYVDFDEPTWDRIGITATPDRQYVWIDRPDHELASLPAE